MNHGHHPRDYVSLLAAVLSRSSMLELVNTRLSCHEGALGLRRLTASRPRWLVFFPSGFFWGAKIFLAHTAHTATAASWPVGFRCFLDITVSSCPFRCRPLQNLVCRYKFCTHLLAFPSSSWHQLASARRMYYMFECVL